MLMFFALLFHLRSPPILQLSRPYYMQLTNAYEMRRSMFKQIPVSLARFPCAENFCGFFRFGREFF